MRHVSRKLVLAVAVLIGSVALLGPSVEAAVADTNQSSSRPGTGLASRRSSTWGARRARSQSSTCQVRETPLM